MLIIKTPLRISFFGGGSDLPAFMEKEAGASLTVTIDKFVYVIINKTGQPMRFVHDDIQQEENITNMRNKIVKEALITYPPSTGLDIVSLSDVPKTGSGLGGSSAFTIGLLRGLWRNQEWYVSGDTDPANIAERACEIEIDKCGYPIGIQDQYAIAYGGFNLFKYYGRPRYAVKLDHNISPESLKTLQSRLCLIYSGLPRSTDAGTILQYQQKQMDYYTEKFELMRRIRDRAYQAVELLQQNDHRRFGELLHENWMDKKQLSESLSNDRFEEIYQFALENRAIGGKVLGAGGGGFMLFYSHYSHNPSILGSAIEEKFPNSKYYPFTFYNSGSTITQA